MFRFPSAGGLSPGCRPVHVLEENLAGCLELVSDESEAEHPASEGVLGVLLLLGLGACVLDFVGQFAHGDAELNVALDLTAMDAALLVVASLVGVGIAELEEPELDRSVAVEKAVEIEHIMFIST